MKRVFLFLLLELFAALVSVNSEENQDAKALNDAKEISEVLRTVYPVTTIKRIPNANSNRDNGTKCTEQLTLLQKGLTKGSIWALQMIDASSKIPSGVLMGNQVDLGMFDECIQISVNVDGHEIRGRHCMYHVMTELVGLPISQALSICLPASCEADDVKRIMKSAIEPVGKLVGLNVSMTIGETMCTAVDPPEWTVGGIMTLIGFSLLLLFLVVSTICDFYIKYSGEKPLPNGRLERLCKFSLYTNAVRILSTTSSPETLPVLQGLRFYSMCYIIMGHANMMILVRRSINPIAIGRWYLTWGGLYQVVVPYAVDTFFTISGFLMAHGFLKDMSTGQSFNLFRYYLHRYIRLTPAFMALLLSAIFITPRLGSGPLWESNATEEARICSNHWWTMLLYIHNYLRDENTDCLGHTWYLAVEMHFYWLSPLILYPLAKKPKIGLCILATFFIASVVTLVKIGHDNKYSSAIITLEQMAGIYMRKFYFVSHVRAAPWLIGMFCGYLYFTQKGSLTSKVTKWIGWLLTIAAFSFCILSVRIMEDEDYEYNIIWESVYTALEKSAWGFAVSWIIYASSCGFGGPVAAFLSFPIYNPLSRLSYCAYLVHFHIQYMKSRSGRVPYYFSSFNSFNHFLSDLLLSFMVAFVFSLVFETPFMTLDKMFIKKNGRSKKDDTKNGLKLREVGKGH